MKIGVLTFWTTQDNYGQVLQAYALQKYLLEAGHSPFIIRYNHSFDHKRSFTYLIAKLLNPKKVISFINKRVSSYMVGIDEKNNSREFDVFKKTHLKFSEQKYYSYEELKSNPPKADCYIVGSDQVWHCARNEISYAKNVIHSFFLDFGAPDTKRLSYAASWSLDSISTDVTNEIKPLLQNFNYVSVREKKGVDLCKQCGCNNAELVCDPTLLFDGDFYRHLYTESNIKRIRKPYIFLYMLNNGYKFPLDIIYKWAADNNLEILYVTGNGTITNRKKENLTIQEWLYSIDHASAVVTNSFHATIFSILFEKPIGVIPLTGHNSGMNSRLESLFALSNIGDHFIRSEENLDILTNSISPKMNLSRDRLKDVLEQI